jgi:hypothetical protein
LYFDITRDSLYREFIIHVLRNDKHVLMKGVSLNSEMKKNNFSFVLFYVMFNNVKVDILNI